METKNRNKAARFAKGFMGKHPIIANILIIIVIAVLGIWIAYLSLAIFTNHGEYDVVPDVTDMSYTEAIEKLNEHGFKTEIRDSVYQEKVRPGYVIEQIPRAKSNVKPGRKILLYINAVHPKQVLVDGTSNNKHEYALKGLSLRQGRAQLEELGFKKIKERFVPGTTDRIVKITANGKTVHMMEKVPVNATIVIEVCNGMQEEITDTLPADYSDYDSSIEEVIETENENETGNEKEEEIIFIEESAQSNDEIPSLFD